MTGNVWERRRLFTLTYRHSGAATRPGPSMACIATCAAAPPLPRVVLPVHRVSRQRRTHPTARRQPRLPRLVELLTGDRSSPAGGGSCWADHRRPRRHDRRAHCVDLGGDLEGPTRSITRETDPQKHRFSRASGGANYTGDPVLLRATSLNNSLLDPDGTSTVVEPNVADERPQRLGRRVRTPAGRRMLWRISSRGSWRESAGHAECSLVAERVPSVSADVGDGDAVASHRPLEPHPGHWDDAGGDHRRDDGSGPLETGWLTSSTMVIEAGGVTARVRRYEEARPDGRLRAACCSSASTNDSSCCG